ncbi:MAG: PD-(D/E)XK nuclease family protein [Elusimicrobia bacterium]|nr:PD-(D/E)XK nuclease family protein [Elusimicrobiota bacterium]
MKTVPLFLSLSLLINSVSPAMAQSVRAISPVGPVGIVGSVGAALSAPVPATFNIPSLSVPSLNAPSIGAPNAVVVPSALIPALAIPAVPAAAIAVAPLAASKSIVPSALHALQSAILSAPSTDDSSRASDNRDGGRAFDGSAEHEVVLAPAFEPPTASQPAPTVADQDEVQGDNLPQRPQLSFQPAQKSALTSIEAGQGLYGTMKMVKDNPYSRDWWNAYKKGVEIDVVVRGENVYNRPTQITFAVTKPIGKLTREDFEGTIPKHMMQAGVVALRKDLQVKLEENRRRWSPEQPPVSLETKVRVVKFESYLDLFKKTNGKDAIPQPEAPVVRAPLKVKPEGALKPLSLFLPRAVMLDLDLFDGPVSKETLSDMAKLQRTGVYFVFFSRKPYEAASAMKDKLVKQLSAYQMSILMPIRFMMVTDDGAVISELPRGGSPEAVDVLAFSLADIDMLRDAAKKAAEQAGVSPRGIEEIRQSPLVERENRFGDQGVQPLGPDPRVRFEVRLPKAMSDQSVAVWLKAYDTVLAAQGMKVVTKLTVLPDGKRSFTVARTTLENSMDRLNAALGEKFGLYLNPGDALVISADPKIMAANSKSIDVAKLTGLKGEELVENALGLMLGEHRDNQASDLSGSASRIASFSYNKGRYLSEILIKMDNEEQNINFFSGHVVHAAMDWLIWKLQNGQKVTREEFAAHLSDHWNSGLREFKAVGMPPAHLADSWLKASLTRADSMYTLVNKINDRQETLVGTEIPNFFVLKDFQRKTAELKRRYILHTIFDFIALRPDPKRPGHATLVIYDFKTGPAKTGPKLDKDIQVLMYALFATEKWVGEKFPAPYLAGDKAYTIDDVSVEFIYSGKIQPTTINRWSLDKVRTRIIGALNRIHAAEQKLFGNVPAKKKLTPAQVKAKAAKAKKAKAAKAKAAKAATPKKDAPESR